MAKIDALRKAIAAASPTGKETVTTGQLAQMLGVENDESQKQCIRKNMFSLTQQGELEKVRQGVWRPTGKERDRRGSGYLRMWRAVRSAPGTICAADLTRIATIERSTASKYLRHLHDAGLVKPVQGKSKNTLYYIITSAGRAHRKTPYPAKPIVDPFRAERIAAAAICKMLLLEDLRSERIRGKIKDQLQVLNDKFMGQEARTDNHFQEEER